MTRKIKNFLIKLIEVNIEALSIAIIRRIQEIEKSDRKQVRIKIKIK